MAGRQPSSAAGSHQLPCSWATFDRIVLRPRLASFVELHRLELRRGEAGQAVHDLRGREAVVVGDGEGAGAERVGRRVGGLAGGVHRGRPRPRGGACARPGGGVAAVRTRRRDGVTESPRKSSTPAAWSCSLPAALVASVRPWVTANLPIMRAMRHLVLALLDQLREQGGALEEQPDRGVDEEVEGVLDGLLDRGLLPVAHRFGHRSCASSLTRRP